ncbi:hypothetical protein SAMN05443144_12529 [Fodinibius roseus]|uniref:PIN domain-containing protein n=1 Tax=Fodinibius roseus TaxID=1194090 RepID=A0A1M5J0S9_9BACT|nr:type II toxin-antitoxin system VapC family toxin [Fodinibius roseus]SHG33909.1 hypothetical protein SAMN05443144_12529 [Fodinibius roseus]
MSGNILADTSLLVNFFNGVEIANKVMEGQHIWVSCITEIELLSYSNLSEDEEKLIQSFLDKCSIVELSPAIRKVAIDIRKTQNLKVPDSIIAATSEHIGFPLVTMDSDFEKLPDIDLILLEY